MSSASDTTPPTEDEPLAVPARLPYEKTYHPFWTRLLGPVQTLVELLPSHKNSRKGRALAKRIQIGFGAVGLGIVIFAGNMLLRVVGAVMVVGALFLPISEVQKRSHLGRLRSLRKGKTRTITRPGRVVYDGRRVLLEKEGSKLRRVLTDRDAHALELQRTESGRIYLKIAPESGGASDAIWVGTDDVEPEELEEPPAIESIESTAPKRPALVEGTDWLTLWKTLRSA